MQYVRKLKPRRYAKTGARQLGTRVHSALEVYYGIEGEAGRAGALAYLEQLRVSELSEVGDDLGILADIEKEHLLAVTMVEGYCDWAAEEGIDSDLEIISTEAILRTASPLEGVELIGKLDAEGRKRSTGEEFFMDHKTVGDLQTPLKTLGMDEQFRMYALMRRIIAAQEGRQPIRFQLYNMLKKSKRTQRAKPPFFSRYEVYISDAELRAFWDRLFGELLEMRRFEELIEAEPHNHRRIAYPTPTNTCSWDCDFYGVCPMLDDDAADPEYLLEGNYEPGDPHAHYGADIDSDEGSTTMTNSKG